MLVGFDEPLFMSMIFLRLVSVSRVYLPHCTREESFHERVVPLYPESGSEQRAVNLRLRATAWNMSTASDAL